MKARFLIINLLCIVSAFYAVAQSGVQNLTGHVSDETGAPLPGASVRIAGTGLGTQTDSEGKFIISVPEKGNYTLRISFTGFESVNKTVSVPQRDDLRITLRQSDIITDEVIVTATRAERSTPVTYKTVTGEMLKRLNTGQELPFTLSLTPSLVETSEAGNGVGYAGFRIRGTEANRINVTLDGIPLNDAESQQVFWVDIPDLVSSVANIQVQRGVGTSTNGAGAFGASVNILTKAASPEPSAGFIASFGSYNTFRTSAEAATGLLNNRFSFRIRVSDVKSDGYILRTGSDNQSMFLSAGWRTSNSILKTNIILGKEKTGISWWGVPADSLHANRRYNPAGEYTDITGKTAYYDNETDNYLQNHYQLIYSLKLSGNILLNTAIHYTYGKGYYEEYREDQKYSKYGLPPVKLDTSFLLSTDLIRRKWMENGFLGLVYSLSWKRGDFSAVLGGGVNRYDGDHFGKIIWMRNSGDVQKDYTWYLNNGTKSEGSIYAKMHFPVAKNISGYADIQYRYIRYVMTGPDDDLRDLSQKHFFSFLNPKAGLFWQVNENQEAYLSFAVAHREPTRSDFKEAAGDPEAMPKHEILYDLEAGYNLKGELFTAGVNLYGMFYDNQLVPTGQLSDVGYPVMTNVKNSFRTGVELSASVNPVAQLAWNCNITLSRNKIKDFRFHYTDYNTTDWSSKYKSINLGTVDIAYSPSATAASDLEYRPFDYLSIHFVSKYVGKQYFDNTKSENRVIRPYFVNNLYVDFRPVIKSLKGTMIQIAVNNVFNNMYESNAYGGVWYEDGHERTWAYYFPQAGINYMVTARFEF